MYILTSKKRLYQYADKIVFMNVCYSSEGWTCESYEKRPLSFNCVNAAVQYVKKHNITGPQLGSDGLVRIKGPSGRTYSSTSGKIYK